MTSDSASPPSPEARIAAQDWLSSITTEDDETSLARAFDAAIAAQPPELCIRNPGERCPNGCNVCERRSAPPHPGDAEIARLHEERDTATRRAEALEADLAASQRKTESLTIKTPREQAMRETIQGQGLSMVAMGKELRDKDAKIEALEAEVGRLRDQLVGERVAGFHLAEHELAYHSRKDSTGDETKAAFHIAANWLSKRSETLGAAPPSADRAPEATIADLARRLAAARAHITNFLKAFRKMQKQGGSIVSKDVFDATAALSEMLTAPPPPVAEASGERVSFPRPTPEQEAYFTALKAKHVNYDPNARIGGVAEASGEVPWREVVTVSDEEWEHFIRVMDSPRGPTPTLTAGIELLRSLANPAHHHHPPSGLTPSATDDDALSSGRTRTVGNSGTSPQPTADHTETAAAIARFGVSPEAEKMIVAALTAAERAAAEKMRALDEAVVEAARAVCKSQYEMPRSEGGVWVLRATLVNLCNALTARDAAVTEGEGR